MICYPYGVHDRWAELRIPMGAPQAKQMYRKFGQRRYSGHFRYFLIIAIKLYIFDSPRAETPWNDRVAGGLLNKLSPGDGDFSPGGWGRCRLDRGFVENCGVLLNRMLRCQIGPGWRIDDLAETLISRGFSIGGVDAGRAKKMLNFRPRSHRINPRNSCRGNPPQALPD